MGSRSTHRIGICCCCSFSFFTLEKCSSDKDLIAIIKQETLLAITLTVVQLSTGSDNSESEYKHEENLNIKGLLSDEKVGVPQFDVKGDSMSFYGSDPGDIVSLDSTDKEQGMFDTDKFCSYNDEAVAGMSCKADERIDIAKPLESLGCAVSAGVSKFDEGKYNEQTNLPREAWWRSYAASIYGRAKKANPFWSIAVAAVVVGLVIIGHRVQRDRSQVFQLKSELGINNEGSRGILVPWL